LNGLRALCDEAGALLIIDEVQTGFGRSGRWFASSATHVVADIITMAKSLGNGMPIGACWAKPEVAAAFRPGDHGSTFGGQPLALAAAKATLAELERIDAPAAARRAGEIVRSRLAGEIPGLVAVRGAGLLLGAEVSVPAGAVVADALERGLILNAVRPDTIRIAPPLTISDHDLHLGLDRFIEALTAVEGAAR
jgi:acetylornithine/succinyldiaminopimelate/putrescine aminotransferase